MLTLTVTILAVFLTFGQCDEQDRVLSLPGLPSELPFKVYSGFLNASEGTYLHYIFVESERNPAEDPVLLWLNGGPGCSSLAGLFTEQGPHRVKRDGTGLEDNPYAWNKISNMIFLESPAGVGFSYNDDEYYATGDDETSVNNFLAVKSFFEKFPQFKRNDFYISGESYAGIYIPTLSVRLLDEPSIRYKGFAIGNGYFDSELMVKSKVFYANYHGFVDPALWQIMTERCCSGVSDDSCAIYRRGDPICERAVLRIIDNVQESGVNLYNINEKCESDSIGSKSKAKYHSNRWTIGRKMLRKSLNTLSTKFDRSRFEKNFTFAANVPCIDDIYVADYLNRLDVRQALNIPQSLPDWALCSDKVFENYLKTVQSVKLPIVKSILAGKQGLIYNGDGDFMCDFLGAQWFAQDLGFPSVTAKQPWHVNNQTAGFAKHYKGFALVTVKGAGHMVPTDRPAAALEMMKTFLEGRMFT